VSTPKIFNHDGESYTIRLQKSLHSFIDGNDQIDVASIDRWCKALNCDRAVNTNRDQLLFLNRIEDAEIVSYE
jgi:hypothetical protein